MLVTGSRFAQSPPLNNARFASSSSSKPDINKIIQATGSQQLEDTAVMAKKIIAQNPDEPVYQQFARNITTELWNRTKGEGHKGPSVFRKSAERSTLPENKNTEDKKREEQVRAAAKKEREEKVAADAKKFSAIG